MWLLLHDAARRETQEGGLELSSASLLAWWRLAGAVGEAVLHSTPCLRHHVSSTLKPVQLPPLQLHFVHFTLENQPLILLFFLIFACDLIHICQLISRNPSIKYAFIRSYFLI